jgi:hypothetical protein
VAAGDVTLDEAACYALLSGPDGPVAELMGELSTQAAAVAVARVRVRRTSSWSARSDASAPGLTKASIRPKVGWDALGLVYGGVTAAEDPTVFLEEPRVDRQRYPFLTTGLDSLEL